MASSSPGDRLAKALHPFLAQKAIPQVLKALGWFDFLSNDRPETADPIEMAAAAFNYLSIEDDGTWNGQKQILTAVVAFLHAHTRKSPTSQDLSDLKKFLEADSVDLHHIKNWFQQVFG